MPTLSRPFTKRAIDATTADASRDLFLWEGGDGAVKGFGLRLRPNGRKTFVFQFDDAGGRTRRLTLGDFGAVTVEQARDAARRAYADAVEARRDPERLDPAAAAKQAKARARAERFAPTVGDLATRYLEDRRRQGKKARTMAQFANTIRLHIAPELGARRIEEVQRRDVAQLHRKLVATPGMANQVLTILRAMFAFAEREELRPVHTNPADQVERYPERSKARGIADAEYAAIGAALRRASRDGLPIPDALRSPSEQARIARATERAAKRGVERTPGQVLPWGARLVGLFRFLALSGWRESEARSLRWSDVDLARGVAVLGETKTGRSTRPLGAAALEVLRGLPRLSDAAYVFPGAKRGAHRGVVRGPWAILRYAAGFGMAADDALSLHGLRHGFTTVARGLGYGDHVIAALIGHTVRGSMTSRYGDVPDMLVRKAANDIAHEIATMLDADQRPAKVLSLHRREA